jgi:hypothetical protein
MRYETARAILSEAIEQLDEKELLQRLVDPGDSTFERSRGGSKKPSSPGIWGPQYRPLRPDPSEPVVYPPANPQQKLPPVFRPDFEDSPQTPRPRDPDPEYGNPFNRKPWGWQPGKPLEIRPPVYSPDGDLIKPAIFPWTEPHRPLPPPESRPERPSRIPRPPIGGQPRVPGVKYPNDAGGLRGPLDPIEIERRRNNLQRDRERLRRFRDQVRDGLNQRPYQSQPRFR